MNKRGFTLIELLAVITIIALISLLAIPNMMKGIKENKTRISDANTKILASAAEIYIQNNAGKYSYSYESNGSTYCIPIQTLIDNGILETPFKDINGDEIDYSNVIKATYEAQYNSFKYEIKENTECTELIQYVSKPQLQESMIPVKYDSSQSKWVKADITSHWYNYQEKNWANAVLVNEFKSNNANSKSRYEYMNAPAGTPILESDVLAYFVWIPRFRYQIFSSSSSQPINIVFESISTTKANGLTTGQWLTHPAFTYNNQELSGIWIGKYETSNNNNKPIIKPSQTSWTNINYTQANESAIQMTNENNIYGLKNVNTHMTRNSEWAATGNKEFVILDNENESSLGYALSETKSWTSNNSYPTTDNPYLTRGNNSIFNYQNSKDIDTSTTFRISLINIGI